MSCAGCDCGGRYALPGDHCARDYFDEPHTLEEVGELLGVGGNRVRVIEAKALVKLRKRLAAEGIYEDVLEGGGQASAATWNGEP